MITNFTLEFKRLVNLGMSQGCSNLHLSTKEQNSKGRQVFERLSCCA